MKKRRPTEKPRQTQPAAENKSSPAGHKGEGGIAQLKANSAGRAASILSSVPAGATALNSQSNGVQLQTSAGQPHSVAQLESIRDVANAFSPKGPGAEAAAKASHDGVMSDLEADDAKEVGGPYALGTAVTESGMGLYGSTDEFVGAVTSSDTDLSADNMEWDDGVKRSDSEQDEWREKHGHSDQELADMKRDDAIKGAVTSSIGTAVSFIGIPSLVRKLRSAENNYERFEQVIEGAGTAAGAVATGAKISDAAHGGGHGDSEATSAISDYTGGIIDLIKSGYKSFMGLKGAYEEYQLVKELGEGEPSKMEGAELALKGAISMAQGVLSSINSFQKSFGSVISGGVAKTIPALGIALSVISLFDRIVTLIANGKLDFDQTGEDTHADTALSDMGVKEEDQATVKETLQDPGFVEYLKQRAEAKQQLRDNEGLVKEFESAQTDDDLKARLMARYPENYARIAAAIALDKEDYNDNFYTSKLLAFGVSATSIDRMVLDQTLLSHLDEIKVKRTRGAQIGIFLDLVNIGADIATLTGTGAAVGTAMKAGTAAVDAARAGGNAIKFAARGKGAEDFEGGATARGFGRSMFDRTDVLKSDKAKRERYFNSSRMILEKIADHDEFAASKAASTTEEDKAAVKSSYARVSAMVSGTGASETMIKAMAHSSGKTANDIVKYIMEKMKSR